MTQKIIITKAGYNGLTETSPDNMVFSSDYDSLKYYSSGSVTLDVAGANAETTVTHNLGYIPFFVVYVNGFKMIDGSTDNQYSMCPASFNDAGFYAFAVAYATTSKIYFRVETNSETYTHTFYYKIFRNTTGL